MEQCLHRAEIGEGELEDYAVAVIPVISIHKSFYCFIEAIDLYFMLNECCHVFVIYGNNLPDVKMAVLTHY